MSATATRYLGEYTQLKHVAFKIDEPLLEVRRRTRTESACRRSV